LECFVDGNNVLCEVVENVSDVTVGDVESGKIVVSPLECNMHCVEVENMDDVEISAAEKHVNDRNTERIKFKLVSAVKQRGRPVRVKQSLLKKKKLVFSNLSLNKRDEIRLSWFVSKDVAKQVLRNGRKIELSELQILNFRRNLDYCAIEELQSYFDRLAWREVVKLKMEKISVCGKCDKETPGRNNKKNNIQWVECDGCLLWFHKACVSKVAHVSAVKSRLCDSCA